MVAALVAVFHVLVDMQASLYVSSLLPVVWPLVISSLDYYTRTVIEAQELDDPVVDEDGWLHLFFLLFNIPLIHNHSL